MEKVEVNVVEHIATIAEYRSGYDLELNLISYNGYAPRYDLRRWDKMGNRMGKGITFTADEADEIVRALKNHRRRVK